MRFNQSLKRRITLSFALFGALLSLLITIGVYYALEDIETEVVENGLNQELQYFIDHGDKRLGTVRQISSDIVLYYANEDTRNILPDVVRQLPQGHAEFEYDSQLFYTLVTPVDDGILYLIRDATNFEKREEGIQISLFASVIVATLVAIWLGRWLSARVISPVSSLAQQVSKLEPGGSHHNPIADKYANDEVGQLAETFDIYLHQIEQFIQREQDFTADASHELRTPLAVISGAAELLRENPKLPQQALKQVERITRAGERMHGMLEILLLLARETPNGSRKSEEQCSAQEVVSDVIEQHRFLAQEKNLKLHSQIIEGFNVNATKTILTIVVSNLVRNAISYTHEGEITVKVINYAIEVRDTGEGIPADALEHIFDRHYRGPSSKGSGIGLSLVKRICDRQGWQVIIQSHSGQGTDVTLKFQ